MLFRRFTSALLLTSLLTALAAAPSFAGHRPSASEALKEAANAQGAELAAAAESLNTSTEEERAQAARAAFDAKFTLDRGEETGGEPNFHAILRKTATRRVGKKKVVFTPDVQFGVEFTGPSSYREGERTPIPPASTNKIFTSAFVLKELGGDYTYDTRLTWVKSRTGTEAGYLTFVGAGDPSLASADLPKLAAEYAAALADAGVKKIYGPLRFSATDPRWNVKAVPDGWETADLRTATGFIPNALGTLIEARVKSALVAALGKKGIKSVAAAAPFAESAGEKGFASHRSAPLRELIQPFVLHSINYKGEAFLRKVGELKGSAFADDLNEAALPLLKEFVSDLLGPTGGFEDVVLNDGSGLSRKSRVTASAMVNFLEAVKSEPYFPDFLAALPVAGRSGTLARRMSGSAAAGRVHAKTGTLDGYYQLAGYLAEAKGSGVEYHPFAILTSTTSASAGYCHAVEDAALESLATWMLKN